VSEAILWDLSLDHFRGAVSARRQLEARSLALGEVWPRLPPAQPHAGREDHKMKNGRTHLIHKAEHAVDLETSAITQPASI
jgi:hypothetical protein